MYNSIGYSPGIYQTTYLSLVLMRRINIAQCSWTWLTNHRTMEGNAKHLEGYVQPGKRWKTVKIHGVLASHHGLSHTVYYSKLKGFNKFRFATCDRRPQTCEEEMYKVSISSFFVGVHRQLSRADQQRRNILLVCRPTQVYFNIEHACSAARSSCHGCCLSWAVREWLLCCRVMHCMDK
jgi:hypothetical protein